MCISPVFKEYAYTEGSQSFFLSARNRFSKKARK